MVSANGLLLHVLRLSGVDHNQHVPGSNRNIPSRSLRDPIKAGQASTAGGRELEVDREVAGASLSQLIDALSAAIIRDAYASGDGVLVALAEAAVLERELSSSFPRRWRVQQALDALLQMGPHVTTALTAVLEHPSARAHIARVFSD